MPLLGPAVRVLVAVLEYLEDVVDNDQAPLLVVVVNC